MPETPQRRIVCAAVRYTDGRMLVGPRHFDHVMHQQAEPFAGVLADMDNEQGFIDQFGAFMGRIEALAIADAAGQIDWERKTNPKHKLYSEDLY